MKKFFIIAIVLLVATAGYSQVRKASKIGVDREVCTMQVTQGIESLKNVQSEPAMVRWNYGEGELDYTTYDWQTNAGPRTWTIQWPDGKVNFAYNYAGNESFADCGTGIGTYDSAADEWIPLEGRIENEKTSFGSIARYKNNGIVVAAHTNTQCGVYIVEDKDNMNDLQGSVSAISYLDPTYNPTFPAVMTSGACRDIVHVVATADGVDGSSAHVPGAEGVNMPIIYFRSVDGGMTWDKQNVILPFMGPEFGINWGSNICYWMETTEDNCLALVVNNAWSDGMVIYSYDDGETWERKVFYHHPGINTTFPDRFMYPRWVSCVWGVNRELCLAYEFNGSTGEPGSDSYDPAIGGVAYWSENMPYFGDGSSLPFGPDPTNPLPPAQGQPFIMDSAYISEDIWASTWFMNNLSTHEMWPEYMGYLSPLNPYGQPVPNPYNVTGFGILELGKHGDYNCGCVAMPVLVKVPGFDSCMIAVWSAMDENNTDSNGNFYFKLFVSCTCNGGLTWSPQIQLTNDFMFMLDEFVYAQATVVGTTLVIAAQRDDQTGSSVHNNDTDLSGSYYQGLTFELYDLFPCLGIGEPEVSHNTHLTIYPNPAADQLNITLSQNAGIVIYNILGQKVMGVEGCVGANSLNISELNAGVYFVSAGSTIQKFIVK